jgi:hypothetical protein
VPFIAERIISSTPDMAAAVVAFPAYISTRTNEILNERLKNDNKDIKDATVSDVAISATKEIPSVSASDNSRLNTNTSAKDMFKFDPDGNLLSQNLGAKNADDTSNHTKVKTVYKETCAPCPAPQRCPESNFDCKKVPNYEQGINNAFLPRPVLADFSTFGT